MMIRNAKKLNDKPFIGVGTDFFIIFPINEIYHSTYFLK